MKRTKIVALEDFTIKWGQIDINNGYNTDINYVSENDDDWKKINKNKEDGVCGSEEMPPF